MKSKLIKPSNVEIVYRCCQCNNEVSEKLKVNLTYYESLCDKCDNDEPFFEIIGIRIKEDY